MAKKVPKSLTDAIEEDPGRFVKYFNLQNIKKSKNPYKEFLKQFEKQFGKQQGLFLWNYILDNYNLTNKFYKLDLIQVELPKKFKGPIKKKIVEEFFEDYKERTSKKQEQREKRIKKPLDVKEHIRDGKEIKGYSKSKSTKYTDIQERFIKARKDENLKTLTEEFNKYFGTSVTSVAIRDKRYRLLGLKK